MCCSDTQALAHSTANAKKKRKAQGSVLIQKTMERRRHTASRTQNNLGSIIDAKQRLLPDIIYSTAAAYNNVRPLRKQVLANKAIDPKKRVWVLQALGIAKAAYAGGTWPALTKQEAKTWNARIFKIYELMEPPQRVGDERAHLYLLATYNLPTPDDILAAQRLRLLAMIARWANEQYLEDVLESAESTEEGTWTQQVLHDFQKFTGKNVDFTNLIQEFRRPTGQREMTKIIKKYHCKMRHVHQQRWRIWQLERKEGRSQPEQRPEGIYPCEKYGKDFTSHTGRAVHLWKVHHVHSKAAHFCPTPFCLACGRNFHTLARVRQHVEYSSMKCLAKLQASYEPMDSHQIDYLNNRERQEAETTWKSGRLTTPQIKTYMKRTETAADSWYGEWTTQKPGKRRKRRNWNGFTVRWCQQSETTFRYWEKAVRSCLRKFKG